MTDNTFIALALVFSVIIICSALIRVVSDILEQRRRETKTGEFEE